MSKNSNSSYFRKRNSRNFNGLRVPHVQHIDNRAFDTASEDDFPTLPTNSPNILAVVSHEVNRMFHAAKPTPPFIEFSTYALTKLHTTSNVDLNKRTKDILEEEKLEIKNRFGLDTVSDPTTYSKMQPTQSALEWHKQSENEGYDSPRIVFNINYQSLKKEVVDEMLTFYQTMNVIGDIVSKLYEKFLFENQNEEGFEEYFKIKKGSLRIQEPFYEDLKSERSEIGEDIDWNNYNHIDQLNRKELHSKIFKFCEKYGIDSATFLKFYQCKMDRNNNTHINLPSIQNILHLRNRMEKIQSDCKINDRIEKKIHISQDDFNKLIEAFKKEIH